MKALTKRKGMLSAASLAAALVALLFINWGVLDRAALADAPPSAALARALGAEWRERGTQASAIDYARALLGAGLHEELLTAIDRDGLLAEDHAAALFRAEAALRQGRFADATAAVASTSGPYGAFLRARATYALTGDTDLVAADLAAALRGPTELAAEAWLFRGRLALDANDLDAATASMRRALESGADPRRAEAIEIEALIRRGFAGEAMRRPAARADLRLAAMASLKYGEARDAARLVGDGRDSRAEVGSVRLLAALAKWRAGDAAQAYALAVEDLVAAPRHWMALDLAAAIARDLGRVEEADGLLARLAVVRPALADWRRRQVATGGIDFDRRYSALAGLSDDLASGGVAAALLGGDEGLPSSVAEPSEAARLTAALAAAINRKDVNAQRRLSAQALSRRDDAEALTLAGSAFARLGDTPRAEAALDAAVSAAPGFFAPARLRADLFARAGRKAEAIDLLASFTRDNPDHAAARLSLAVAEAQIGDMRAAYASFAAVDPALVFSDEAAAILYANVARALGPKETLLFLESARRSAPDFAILGLALAAAGDDDGAAAALRRPLIGGAARPEIAAAYLAAMSRLGRGDEAASLLAELARRHEAVNTPEIRATF